MPSELRGDTLSPLCFTGEAKNLDKFFLPSRSSNEMNVQADQRDATSLIAEISVG
jgi:hypothetical protein